MSHAIFTDDAAPKISSDEVYFTKLDGARGLAALAVVIDHMAHYGLFFGANIDGLGSMGVILFYSLSGFLMAFLYLHRPFTSRGIYSYLLSRVSRVLPMFYTSLFLGACLLIVAGNSGYSFFDARGFLSNLLLIRGTGVLWSVPIEIHFYAIFIILWLGASLDRLWFVVIGLLVVCLLFGASLWAASSSHRWIFYFIHVFLAGCAIALWYRARPELFAALSRHPIFVVGAWAMIPALYFVIPTVRHTFGQPVIPIFLDPLTVGYPILILIASLAGIGPFRYLSLRPLRWLGSISFSLYLLHMPIIFLFLALDISEFLSSVTVAVITLTAVIISAWASVWLVERPAQHALKSRFAIDPR